MSNIVQWPHPSPPSPQEQETCALCKKPLPYPKELHVDLRDNYVGGAGDLCPECDKIVYPAEYII
ncbi:MAG TPA: hypothetical protein VJZ52_01235 [Candidatus Paceibacterota bacterium]|nr:hypothetical protein [Candidatus Paceibacterota bacterium]